MADSTNNKNISEWKFPEVKINPVGQIVEGENPYGLAPELLNSLLSDRNSNRGIPIGNFTELKVGSGESIFRVTKEGLYLGSSNFDDATFSVSINGDLTTSSFNLVGQSKVRAYRGTSTQFINNATWTKVQLNAESYDTESEFDNLTNFRFTATQAGYYQVNATLLFEDLGAGRMMGLAIYKSGAAYAQHWAVTAADTFSGISISDVIPLALDSVYSTDQIPTMTSATAPSGVVSTSYAYSADYAGWKAMDNNTATYWSSNGTTGWIQYQFATSKVVKYYTITLANTLTNRAPTAWTLQGSNDGSTWTTLDTRTGITSWSLLEKKEYSVDNQNSYIYYRINITANNGGANLELAEVELMTDATTIGDYLELYAWQNYGTPMEIQSGTANTFMSIHRLS